MTRAMIEELPREHKIRVYDNLVLYDDDIYVDTLKVEVIKTSHDTKDSKGFILSECGKSVVYLTDTGYLNQKYFPKLRDKSVYLFESNHDIEMLRHGPYPRWLQDRVLSDVGHLSNKFTGIYLSKLITENTKNIVLLHLSEKNNTEELALETVEEYIDPTKVKIQCANKNDIGSVITI